MQVEAKSLIYIILKSSFRDLLEILEHRPHLELLLGDSIDKVLNMFRVTKTKNWRNSVKLIQQRGTFRR